MKKCSVILLMLIGVLLPGLATDLFGDVTLDYKASISGIPFLSGFEMLQTMAMRPGQIASTTAVELALPDTVISDRSLMLFNTKNRIMTLCSLKDSSYVDISLSGIDSLLASGLARILIDTLRFFQGQIKEYLTLDTVRIELTENRQKVQDYDCRELVYDFSGHGNAPAEELSGSIKFSLRGSSWVTEDIPNFKDYRENMNEVKGAFFSPRIIETLKQVFEIFGIQGSLIDNYLEIYSYIYVSTALSLRVELWSPEMDTPSLTFDIRINSVLQDIAFDKLPDEVFQCPPGFHQKLFNLFELFKGWKHF